MNKMKVAAGVLAAVIGLPIVGIGGFYGWAVMTTRSKLSTVKEVHTVDFPIPFPLTEAEITALRAEKAALLPRVDPAAPVDPMAVPPDPLAGVDLGAIATERAVARGKHLLEARYPCGLCHGENLGGGTMVDSPVVGHMMGANLTLGKGSRTLAYTAADWDHTVRHGIKPSGMPTVMPAKDFFAMSDRELSDIVAYIRSFPPVDHEADPVTFGPLFNVLIATGQVGLSADEHPTKNQGAHLAEPPAEAPDAAFGEHLAQICTGCHRPNLAGGPITGGPPEWPPAGNLTALQTWNFEDFQRALREARRPDGTELKPPMKEMIPMASKMTDVEFQAMWAYIQSLPATETGK